MAGKGGMPEWKLKLAENEEHIFRLLDIELICMHLLEERVIASDERQDILLPRDVNTKKRKVIVKLKNPLDFKKFLKCLEKSKTREHLELKRILEGGDPKRPPPTVESVGRRVARVEDALDISPDDTADNIKEKLAARDRDLQQAREENKQLRDRIDRLEAEKKEMEKRLKESDDKNEELKKELDATKAELQRYLALSKSQLDRIESLETSMKTLKEQHEKDIDDIKQEHRKDMDDIKQDQKKQTEALELLTQMMIQNANIGASGPRSDDMQRPSNSPRRPTARKKQDNIGPPRNRFQ